MLSLENTQQDTCSALATPEEVLDEGDIVKSKPSKEIKAEGKVANLIFCSEESAKRTVIHSRNMHYFSKLENRRELQSEFGFIVDFMELGYYLSPDTEENDHKVEALLDNFIPEELTVGKVQDILETGKIYILLHCIENYIKEKDDQDISKTLSTYIYWYLSAFNIDAAEKYTIALNKEGGMGVYSTPFHEDVDSKYNFSKHLGGTGNQRDDCIKSLIISKEIALSFLNVAQLIKKYIHVPKEEKRKLYLQAFDIILNIFNGSERKENSEFTNVEHEKCLRLIRRAIHKNLYQKTRIATLISRFYRQPIDLTVKYLASRSKRMQEFTESILFISQVDPSVEEFVLSVSGLDSLDQLLLIDEEERNNLYGELAVKLIESAFHALLGAKGSDRYAIAVETILENMPKLSYQIQDNHQKFAMPKEDKKLIDSNFQEEEVQKFRASPLSLFILFFIKKNNPEIPREFFREFDKLELDAKMNSPASVYQILDEVSKYLEDFKDLYYFKEIY